MFFVCLVLFCHAGEKWQKAIALDYHMTATQETFIFMGLTGSNCSSHDFSLFMLLAPEVNSSRALRTEGLCCGAIWGFDSLSISSSFFFHFLWGNCPPLSVCGFNETEPTVSPLGNTYDSGQANQQPLLSDHSDWSRKVMRPSPGIFAGRTGQESTCK